MTGSKPSIVIVICYFGKWPPWINLFIETCKHNPSINWLIVTDCADTENKADNVRFLRLSFKDFSLLLTHKLGFSLDLSEPYKIANLKPTFGYIFEDQIKDFDFFGWGDIDVFYGDIRSWVKDDILRDYEALSFHGADWWVSNHFLILKNTPELRSAFRGIDNFESLLKDNAQVPVDDVYFTKILLKHKIFAKESFSTPNTGLILWRDGTRIYPTEWYWQKGKITNNKDEGVEFPYFHFMAWKDARYAHRGGEWLKKKKIVNFDYRQAPYGWKINKKGIFAVTHSPLEKACGFFSRVKIVLATFLYPFWTWIKARLK